LSAVIEVFAIRGVELHSAFYLWTAPVWLLWYLCAIWQGDRIQLHDFATVSGESP
jgi:hypothetical protein